MPMKGVTVSHVLLPPARDLALRTPYCIAEHPERSLRVFPKKFDAKGYQSMLC